MRLFFNITDKLDTGMGCAFCILIILLAIGLLALSYAFGFWLWGIIAVKIFGLPVLSFWQFVGLTCLTHIIFPSGVGTTTNNNNNK